MSMSFADVDEILRIIDQFPAAEIRLKHGDLKLYVKRKCCVHGSESNYQLSQPLSTGVPNETYK